jgi:phage terminase Nu1 subunit (DNA packaging protein)
MNQSEFAALHDVSRKTVTKWKERGWLVFAGDEVDVAASNANLKKYRRDGLGDVTQPVTQGAEVTTGRRPKKAVTPSDAEVTVRPDETPAGAAERILAATGMELYFDEARCMKENYLALLNQLEYDQKSGLVVAVADVAKAVGDEYAKVRTKLLAIPAEQAPRIHRLKTVLEVQDALQEMINHALEELTRDGVGGTA